MLEMLLAWVQIYFESYCGSMIASIALAASMTSVTVNKLGGDQSLLQLLPLILASLGLICSLIES